MNIKFLPFTNRVQNRLAHIPVTTVEELIVLSESQLRCCPYLGAKCAKEINSVLESMGLSLSSHSEAEEHIVAEIKEKTAALKELQERLDGLNRARAILSQPDMSYVRMVRMRTNTDKFKMP